MAAITRTSTSRVRLSPTRSNCRSWSTRKKVVLPAAAPTILTGMRISIGIAWLVIVAKARKQMAYGYRDTEYFFLKIRAAFPGKMR